MDLSNKTIKWSVDGQQRASHTHDILGDKARSFMPYVDFHGTNDSVEFIK